MHPTHVPLVPEAEPAEVHGPGHRGERRRLLRDGVDARASTEHDRVHLLQEVDRLEVLAATELVRHPLAFLAGVVEVQHRRDGIDAQTVDVELLHPVQRAREEEVADLVPSEVEHERAPVGMLALARIGVLVQRGAVETSQRPLVLREVRGHPVDDHADALGVERVDEHTEVVRRSVARRRRVVRGDLIPPGPTERVLGHRHQLDVGEAEIGDVVGQLLGELEVGQRTIAVLRHAPPRAEVHFVGRHPLVDGVRARASREPVIVVPLHAVLGDDHRCGAGRDLRAARHRISLEAQPAVGADDLELVLGSPARRRARTAPTRPDEPSDRIGWTRPSQQVEVADDPDRARPTGAHTANAVPAVPSCTR